MYSQATDNFDPGSKVWIYMADRNLSDSEKKMLEDSLSDFCSQWTAHNHQLKATSGILFDRYVVLVVDETQAGASGCSIDKSVHFLQKAGQMLNTDFFVRNMVAVNPGKQTQFVPFTQIPSLLAEGVITAETPVVDTTVAVLGSLESGLVKPLAETWLKRYLSN